MQATWPIRAHLNDVEIFLRILETITRRIPQSSGVEFLNFQKWFVIIFVLVDERTWNTQHVVHRFHPKCEVFNAEFFAFTSTVAANTANLRTQNSSCSNLEDVWFLNFSWGSYSSYQEIISYSRPKWCFCSSWVFAQSKWTICSFLYLPQNLLK